MTVQTHASPKTMATLRDLVGAGVLAVEAGLPAAGKVHPTLAARLVKAGWAEDEGGTLAPTPEGRREVGGESPPAAQVDLFDATPGVRVLAAELDTHVCECGGMFFEDDGEGRCRVCGGEEPNGVEERVVLTAPPTAARPVVSRASSVLDKVLAPAPAADGRPPHVIVKARAGTGKTTTLVEGLKVVKGLTPSITPSEQQAAVWEQLTLSRGARTVCFCAFGNAVAAELRRKVPAGCDASTLHSMGYKAVRRAFPGLTGEPSKWKVQNVTAELLGLTVPRARKDKLVVLLAVDEIVEKVKQNLVPTDARDEQGAAGVRAALEWVCDHYDIRLNDGKGGPSVKDEVFALVPKVVERCKDPAADGYIDFNDMVWLPVALGLPVSQYDLLLVDEAQDLNRAQQALARKAGKRLVLCGDPQQSIYGFAGADGESMPRMFRELGDTPEGCVELPLTVTRRCGKAIVAEAKRIVGDFEAHDGNGEGEVLEAKYPVQRNSGYWNQGSRELPYEQTYLPMVQDRDLIVCRVTSILVSQCFRFLRAGRKANILGRKVGDSLVALVKDLKAESAADLITKVGEWVVAEIKKENAKQHPSENRLILLQDKADCLVCFTEGAATVGQVIDKINSVFTDDENAPGVLLATIHKAKGLEARRVFFLRPHGGECPHPTAKSNWECEQEMNLLYVGITRAIDTLVFVY